MKVYRSKKVLAHRSQGSRNYVKVLLRCAHVGFESTIQILLPTSIGNTSFAYSMGAKHRSKNRTL